MKKLASLLALIIVVQASPADATDKAAGYGQGVRLDLDESGDTYVRFITWHQLWTRFTEYNPGTEVQGNADESGFDVGLRRSRFLAYGRLADDVLILMHIGINNQTFNNARKPQLFVHGAWVEYDVVDGPLSLSMGGGLHYWHGISRQTNASTLNFLTLDAPILNWPTIERSDQFARSLGIYAKGKLEKIDYRVALNRPFATDRTMGEAADYNPNMNTFSVEAYLSYQFLEQEGNLLPYTVGTYLGKKRVFNLGAGFLYHPDSMARLPEGASDPEIYDSLLFGADAFLDLPLGNAETSGALTSLLTYYYYDLGPNHLRNVGIMNIGSGGTSANGAGNAYPTIGTGHHVHLQTGYLLPSRYLLGQQLQIYGAGLVSLFDALDDPSVLIEAGANWHLIGHHAKVTVHYRNRPIFADTTVEDRAHEAIVQTMIFF